MHPPADDISASLRQALDDLRLSHQRGAGGHELARRRADLLDLTLISLFRRSEQAMISRGSYREAGLAVLAIGGYGRRELCPRSDVDLMLLYQPREKGQVQEMAESLFYPLWDAGLELGHGARTIDECVAVAGDSLETQTALLQARFLVGDQQLYRELSERLQAQVAADGGHSFISALSEIREARHSEFGDSASLVEPHLKEGKGGLRDIHELLWAAQGLHGAAGLEALAGLRWLEPEALPQLELALEMLLRARTGLHYLAGRKVDRIYRDFQEELAPLLGGSRAAGDSASTGGARFGEAMSDVTEAALTVAFLAADAWEVVRRDAGLSGPRTLSRIPATLPQAPEERRVLLLELLREGDRGLPRLERLSHLGSLSEWLPGWEAIRSRGQTDSLHTYTIDAHSFRCAAVAVELATTGTLDSLGAGLAAELALSSHWESLLLACLLHDLGKGVPQADHSEAGAGLASQAAALLGEPEEVQQEIAMLVAEHLLLADTATRRDLDDASLLGRLAERIGSRTRLEMLYVLTVADSLATGPASWTPWRATLVQELFFKLLHLIEGIESSPEMQAAGGAQSRKAVYAEALAAMPERDAGRVSRDYLLDTAIRGGPAGPVSIRVQEGLVVGVQELYVSSPPYRGLLTRLCGVLTYHGMNIMGAQFQSGEGDLLVRSFQVADFFGQDIAAQRWELFARDLGRALEGRFGLEHRLAEKRSRYRRAGKGSLPTRAEVVLENSASDSSTVIEVHAQDRIGLLYTIARTLDDLLLEVTLAKVATLNEQVVDVFYVSDSQGGKITAPEHLREIEQAVLFALREER